MILRKARRLVTSRRVAGEKKRHKIRFAMVVERRERKAQRRAVGDGRVTAPECAQ